MEQLITIQLFVATKGNFFDILIFWKSHSEEESPTDYLIIVATCLFARN